MTNKSTEGLGGVKELEARRDVRVLVKGGGSARVISWLTNAPRGEHRNGGQWQL